MEPFNVNRFSSERRLGAMVLAAGRGSRMKSERPKALHLLCGRPMTRYVMEAIEALDLESTVVVVGYGAESVTKTLYEQSVDPTRLDFVEQNVQRGTGDAVSVGLQAFEPHELDDDSCDLMVLPGDTPLLKSETLTELHRVHVNVGAAATLLTAQLEDPSGYGRIVRDGEGRVERIVEQADAAPEELKISEVNTSIYCFDRSVLTAALRKVDSQNNQGEYYLTDVIQVLRAAGHAVAALMVDDPNEVRGVNDRQQLAECEAAIRQQTNKKWMAAGVTMVDPKATYIDATVVLSPDVTLFPNTLLQGDCVIGEGSEVGPDVRLTDTFVGARSHVQSTSATQARIGDNCQIGPDAVLNSGVEVASGTVTGPFYTSLKQEL